MKQGVSNRAWMIESQGEQSEVVSLHLEVKQTTRSTGGKVGADKGSSICEHGKLKSWWGTCETLSHRTEFNCGYF